ncbi:hypothetical protein NYZ99_15985 [Maribacter litopenaei]|uniref:Uncharacterized protein n=1 Tax=Maribacter litopenaei TaxID=2976127 RepID=A0ABY5Y6C8_9FLAO|nr:hypothetical protein [Maribacter litopenaei]UWX54408.1 hypothetical protein NYZ99_15985 [Maribacter litopenaei]
MKIINSLKAVPILAVPDSFNFQQLKTVIFSTDFMKAYDKFELESLMELVNISERRGRDYSCIRRI